MDPISGKTIFGAGMRAQNLRDQGSGYIYNGCSFGDVSTGLAISMASGVVGLNSLNTFQGIAAQTATAAAADPTLPRVDSIYIDTSQALRFGTGTPAASDPVPPAWGAGVVPVGFAFIPPGATGWGSPGAYTEDWRVFNKTAMASRGDILYGASEGFAQRLGIGTSGQVLTVSNSLPVWSTPASGMTNPMTSIGDMIYASTGGLPTRLGIGASGTVLTVAGGLPTWASIATPTATGGTIPYFSPALTSTFSATGGPIKVTGASVTMTPMNASNPVEVLFISNVRGPAATTVTARIIDTTTSTVVFTTVYNMSGGTYPLGLGGIQTFATISHAFEVQVTGAGAGGAIEINVGPNDPGGQLVVREYRTNG